MELFRWRLMWIFLLPWLQVAGGNGFLIKNVRLGKCIHASPFETEQIGLSECKPHLRLHQWSWDGAARALVNLKTGQCLTVHKPQEFALAQLEPCQSSRHGHQVWVCSKKGHLSLQGLGLHLSTKPGGHKAFLLREKDKFSRWKTLADGIICAAEQAVAPGLSTSMEEPIDPLVRVPTSTTGVASAEIHNFSVGTTTTFPAPVFENGGPHVTSALPRNDEVTEEGTNWKTVMLILSPLAFLLGLVILALNMHYNKKRKILSALNSGPEKPPKVSYEERLPLSGPACATCKTQTIPAHPPSPPLKHGEILIEWKDGTITPLFNSLHYQIC